MARRGPTADCCAWPIASDRFYIKIGILLFSELPALECFLLGFSWLLVLERRLVLVEVGGLLVFGLAGTTAHWPEDINIK